MKITKGRLRQIILEEFGTVEETLPPITQAPEDIDAPWPVGKEMDTLTAGYEESIQYAALMTDVPDFDGSMLPLDEFLSKLGNYVVTGGVTEKQANAIVQHIANNMTIDKNSLQYWDDEAEHYEEYSQLMPETKKKTKVSKPGQERVSKKIAHLIGDEDKSKEQAAAIAYSMEERGELGQ